MLTNQDFSRWRQLLGYSQTEAAVALGRSVRTVSAYETGEKPIPQVTCLACAAIAHGIVEYSGKDIPA